MLREGGNAVDAAVAAVLMSFVCESPLTGPGAGGFMLVHTAEGEDHLLDFFVSAPGRDLGEREPSPLMPIEVEFAPGATQVFNVGASSCGAYGTTAGLAQALERFGSMPLAELCAEPARVARDGVELNEMQAFILRILAPILTSTPECSAIYAPEGRPAREGEHIHLPELGDLLGRLGSEGPGFLYEGDVAAAASDYVLERGGLLTPADLAAYEVIEREPARAAYGGREVLTNPPPSSGGILIADALELLARLSKPGDLPALVGVMESVNNARDAEFLEGLASERYHDIFLADEALERVAGEVARDLDHRSNRLGNTTHLAAMDADGACATCTCSNGSCSGVVVPGTGLHLNNMLGEEDLNPLGFHRQQPGARVPSMMSPTVVLRDGEVEAALGSAGSNRIRSAVLQTILGVIDGALGAQAAVNRPRLHFENDVVEAEPGFDDEQLRAIERAGWKVDRWNERNLYFGGVQAVVRDRATGALTGGGDPRRGGTALTVS